MKRVYLLLPLLIMVTGYFAGAQLVVDPAQQAGMDRIEGGLNLTVSSIKYKLEGGSRRDIDRTVFGGYSAYGWDDQFDVYGALGLIINAGAEGVDGSGGNGFLLAAGGRMDLMDVDIFDILLYGQLGFVAEDYGRVNAHLVEISGGVIARCMIDRQVNVYGGLDFYPVSEGSADGYDFGRNSLFGMRLGANADLGEFWLRSELAFWGELTVVLGAGTYF